MPVSTLLQTGKKQAIEVLSLKIEGVSNYQRYKILERLPNVKSSLNKTCLNF